MKMYDCRDFCHCLDDLYNIYSRHPGRCPNDRKVSCWCFGGVSFCSHRCYWLGICSLCYIGRFGVELYCWDCPENNAHFGLLVNFHMFYCGFKRHDLLGCTKRFWHMNTSDCSVCHRLYFYYDVYIIRIFIYSFFLIDVKLPIFPISTNLQW